MSALLRAVLSTLFALTLTLAGVDVTTRASAVPERQLVPPPGSVERSGFTGNILSIRDIGEAVNSRSDDDSVDDLRPDAAKSPISFNHTLSAVALQGRLSVAHSSGLEQQHVPIYLLTERLRL